MPVFFIQITHMSANIHSQGKYFLNNEKYFIDGGDIKNINTLQTPLKFEKSKGYFNNQIIFVSYDSNGQLQKHVF